MDQYPPEGHYPYRDDGLLFWNTITEFVESYLQVFYASDEDVQSDYELQAWFTEVTAPNGGRLHGLLKSGAKTLTTYELLAKVTYINFVLKR